MRTYDIINAGPNNRFMANGRIVSNSGSIVQLQNLYRNNLADLDQARELVKAGDYDAIDVLYDSVPDVLAQCVRTAFVPQKGMKFIVADFSAIEARVVAWIAGEQWKLDAFAAGKDIYCATASEMYHKPVVKHGENGELRQHGKICELACISIDSPVLTDVGLVPIQKVTKEMKLWDGEEWVSHDGVIYKGEREVITYDGLTATPDHLVFVEGQPRPVRFDFTATCSSHLIQTGDGRRAILAVCTRCSNQEIISRTDAGRNYTRCGKSCIRETEKLAWNTRTVKVYDILNTGRHHRFTVSGRLVHNCGYGGSVGALKAFGALENGMKEEELQPMVDAWRSANSRIVQLWYDVENAVKTVLVPDSKGNSPMKAKTHGLVFEGAPNKMLFIELPSGRRLSYVKPHIGMNRFGNDSIMYWGVDNTRHWGEIESFGGKLVENIVQAISRDILCHAIMCLRDYRIVAHVHDEVIIECPKSTGVETVCELMATVPKWAEGLPLRADGFECMFYKKD